MKTVRWHLALKYKTFLYKFLCVNFSAFLTRQSEMSSSDFDKNENPKEKLRSWSLHIARVKPNFDGWVICTIRLWLSGTWRYMSALISALDSQEGKDGKRDLDLDPRSWEIQMDRRILEVNSTTGKVLLTKVVQAQVCRICWANVWLGDVVECLWSRKINWEWRYNGGWTSRSVLETN